MKKLYNLIVIAIISCICTIEANAQNNVGIGTTTPDASSILEMQSTTQGVLVPRMLAVARLAIVTPANGLLVYDLDSMCFFYYKAGIWTNMCTAAATTGPTGPIGPTGVGAVGPTGANGVTGPTGIHCWDLNGNNINDPAEDINSDGVWDALDCRGATGAVGATGLTGAVGATGASGADGATGAVGATGLTGATGANGATGLTGAVGATGASGADGATGAVGATGTAGPTGAMGTNGAVGATGPMGPTGPTGFGIGPTGPTGSTGAAGPTGANGTNGTNGATGPTGAAGTNGTNGVTGPTGLTGAAGTNGTNGTNGATGPTGAAGTNGTNGVTGPTGLTGAAGTNGTNGTNGATGPTGLTGTAGTNGTNGTNGATGPTGPDWIITSDNYDADGNMVIVTNQPATITSANRAWLVGGNTFTGGLAYPFGTLSNDHVDFYSNGLVRGRLSNLGEFFIGTTATAMPGDLMNSVANATFPWAVNGYSNQNGGGTYGSVTAGGTVFGGVQGEYFGTNTSGAGVRGIAGAGNNNGVNGQNVAPTTGWAGLFQNDLGYTGFFGVASDEKLKRDIKPINDAISIIKQLNGVTYYHRLDQYPDLGLKSGLNYGFIAQNVETVMPDAVRTKAIPHINSCIRGTTQSQPAEMVKTVNYLEVIPILVEGIKAQQIMIDSLNLDLNKIQSQVNSQPTSVNDQNNSQISNDPGPSDSDRINALQDQLNKQQVQIQQQQLLIEQQQALLQQMIQNQSSPNSGSSIPH